MPGGGTLIIRTSNVAIDSAITRGSELMPPGNYILIEVIDCGIGIPKEILGNIFEPFFTTKETGAGTGLGLSTVYGIVRQTDGFVFVDSAPGEGTRFSIYLPEWTVSQPQPSPGAPEAPADLASPPAAATVLLVDDERPVRVVAARALQSQGYRVIEAASGEDAIDLIRCHDGRIDVLLTDVVMPGIDGFTLARLARRDRPDLQTIVMSGYTEDSLTADSEKARGIHFLQKPFTLAELTVKVSQLAAQLG
jgi:two-component system cell cycle sensor histidine kinase/response regulator CckA